MDEVEGYRVEGVPEIGSQKEWDFLENGMRYISDGQVYTKGRKQRPAPDYDSWGVQDEIINMMLMGYGAEVYGAIDWLAKAIVPDDAFGIERGPDPTLAEAQETSRQKKLLGRELDPFGTTVGQVVGGIAGTGQFGAAGKALTKLFPSLNKIPTSVRGATSSAVQSGLVASGEADPGERLERAKTGAKTGAIISAVTSPLAAIAGFFVKTATGRLNPQKTAYNIVNSGILQSNLSRTEAATAAELAQLPAALQNMPPHLRRAQRRGEQLGKDSTIADAAPGMGARGTGFVATRVAGAGRERAEGLLSSRAAEESSRMVEAVDSAISPAYGEAEEIADTLVKSAGPAYDFAFDITRDDKGEIDRDAPMTVNQDLMSVKIASILSTPNGEEAFDRAIKQMRNEFGWDYRMGSTAKEALRKLLYSAKRNNRGEIISIPDNAVGFSLEALDQVKIQLQQMGEELKKKEFRKNDARIVKGQSRKLKDELDALDQTNGTYAVARQTAEAKFLLLKAYKKGVDALGPKGSSEANRKLMQQYTQGERAMFRAAGASYLRDKILKVPETGKAVRSVFGNALIMKKLSSLIDDKDDLAAIVKAITQEKTYALTQKQILSGGGPDVPSAKLGNQLVGMLSAVAGSNVPGAHPFITAGFFRRLGQAAMGAPANDEIVKILLTRDPEENKKHYIALSKITSDPDASRMSQLLKMALSQQIELKRKTYQVPIGDDQYRLKNFERSMLTPQYYQEKASQAGSALSQALRRFPGTSQ